MGQIQLVHNVRHPRQNLIMINPLTRTVCVRMWLLLILLFNSNVECSWYKQQKQSSVFHKFYNTDTKVYTTLITVFYLLISAMAYHTRL